MKKTIIFITLLFILSGCSTSSKEPTNNTIPSIPDDIKHFYNEYQRNSNAIEKISEYVSNTSNANYAFTYEISNNKNNCHFEGEKFGEIQKYYYNDITYQLENNTIYNLNTKEKVSNIFKSIDTKPLSLNTYYYLDNLEYTCVITNDTAICNSLEKNTTITFTISNKYITKIIYTDLDNTYILEYKNFNNISIIPKINYQTKTNYQKTDSIKKIEVNDDYTIYNYYITDATVIINNTPVSITDTIEIFSNPMYYFKYDYNNYYIEEFIYSDEFMILIVQKDNKNPIYYLTTYQYEKEILDQYK